ncbi:MAG: Fic family protein [Phenylobacterium sp.]|jgi:Fic family protein
MTTINEFHQTLLDAGQPLSVNDLLDQHPDLVKRTIQRWLVQLQQDGKIAAIGKARARRYVAVSQDQSDIDSNNFPSYIPLATDSKDILSYVDQSIAARKPVGYQRDFLDAYQPNITQYLSEPLRNQLRRMGDTKQNTQPAGTHGRAVLNRLLIDLSWASSQLEGNTYSRLDTHELIEYGKVADGKGAIETQMILNHKAAIELLVDNAADINFNRYTMLNLHSALSENLLPNPADEGRVRQHMVEIGKSVFHPLAGESQISETLDVVLAKAQLINDPFEQSFFIMVHLPYLQPFADINKRTSRLAANLPLIRANLCPLTFLDVPEQAYSRATLGVYELTRVELLRDLYVWAYERSTQAYLAIKQGLAAPDPFRLQYREVIKEIVREVVTHPQDESLQVIERTLAKHHVGSDEVNVRALAIEELRRLHEGVLVRYGLRPSELIAWQNRV